MLLYAAAKKNDEKNYQEIIDEMLYYSNKSERPLIKNDANFGINADQKLIDVLNNIPANDFRAWAAAIIQLSAVMMKDKTFDEGFSNFVEKSIDESLSPDDRILAGATMLLARKLQPQKSTSFWAEEDEEDSSCCHVITQLFGNIN